MLIAVQEAAKEAAREIFASCDTTEELPASIAAKIDEAENAGVASAAREFTKCSLGVDVSTECRTKDMQTKMEMEGAQVAKEEFIRLVTEVEEAKRKMEREHRFKSQVEEAARFAAKSVFLMMTTEESEANGGEAIEFYDAEREKLFEHEIIIAGQESALAEFDEFVRIEEMNSEHITNNDVIIADETERLEVELLGKNAALREFEKLKEELRVRLEADAEAELKRIEEENRLVEEARLAAEEEERKRAEEEQERLRKEEEDRLRKEEEERLRLQEEERLRLEEEERQRREEEERLRVEKEKRLKKEKEERLAREEEERLRREEEERLIKEEEDKLRLLEEERLRKEKELRLLQRKAAWLARRQTAMKWTPVIFASLALYWALRLMKEHVEREHRDELDMELQIRPYNYFEIKKWP